MNLAKIGQKVEIFTKYPKEFGLWLFYILGMRKTELAVLMVVLVEFLFPHMSLAQTVQAESSYRVATVMNEETIRNNDPDYQPLVGLDNSLPAAPEKAPKQVIWVTVTAYSSTVAECDSDPCTTANGFNVCEHNEEDVVAANFLPFGATLKMPDFFGDKTFTVQDRMNARYNYHIDVWMKTREAAKQFGVKYLKVEVY